jgi:broad specificity phosphatase PhoE
MNVVSVAHVAHRVSAMIVDLEAQHSQRLNVILVSHGDTLQILQSCFAGVSPAQHRSLPHLHNCEVRELKILTNA